jgi:hypothetical protein
MVTHRLVRCSYAQEREPPAGSAPYQPVGGYGWLQRGREPLSPGLAGDTPHIDVRSAATLQEPSALSSLPQRDSGRRVACCSSALSRFVEAGL